MRRIAVAITLLLIVAGLCWFETDYLNKSFNNERKLLNEIEYSYNKKDINSAVVSSKELEKKWNEYESVLCHFVSSSGLDDVEVEIATLSHILKDDEDSFNLTKRKIEVMMQNIKENEEYTIF